MYNMQGVHKIDHLHNQQACLFDHINAVETPLITPT